MKNTNVLLIILTLLYDILVVAGWIVLAVVFNYWWIALFGILFVHCSISKGVYYRTCDGCGKHSEYCRDKNDAIVTAKLAGWVHVPDADLDYCPECQKLGKMKL